MSAMIRELEAGAFSYLVRVSFRGWRVGLQVHCIGLWRISVWSARQIQKS